MVILYVKEQIKKNVKKKCCLWEGYGEEEEDKHEDKLDSIATAISAGNHIKREKEDEESEKNK